MAILKLDDLLTDDLQFELKGKVWTIDTSTYSFIRFLKWNEKVKDVDPKDIKLEEQNELLSILVKEKEFIDVFSSLKVNDQVTIIKKLIEMWNAEIKLFNREQDNAKK